MHLKATVWMDRLVLRHRLTSGEVSQWLSFQFEGRLEDGTQGVWVCLDFATLEHPELLKRAAENARRMAEAFAAFAERCEARLAALCEGEEARR